MKRLNTYFNSKGYLQGILWMIIACIISSLNDALTKHLGSFLLGAEVVFFRFFFGVLVLIPFMILRGERSFSTNYFDIHCIRVLLLTLAMTGWSYGVAVLPLTLSTTISFTTPFLILPLAKVFLKEHIGWQRWVATLFGIIGIIVSLQPRGNVFNPMTLILVFSTFMFAFLDVINKKLLIKDESLLSMLFYSALGTSILSFIPALMMWKTPTIKDIFFLFLLGSGGNLLLFCLLKAFSATEISALQPFRYMEFILSGIFGFIFFHEIPSVSILLGALIIIPVTFYIAVYEVSKKTKK